MKRVLLIEDEIDMQNLIKEYLQNYEYKVKAFDKPIEALSHLRENDNYDVVVLDLMLPQMDGFDVCKKIREHSSVPIIISSARGELGDKIHGFEIGADDYLAKPYEPRELIARIEAILRRMKKSFKEIGDLKIDENKREVFIEDYQIELTKVEYEILLLMIKNRDKVLSREVIANAIGALDYESNDRAIDMHISNLRQKLGDTPKSPKYIKSVWGVGYKFIG